MSVHLAMAGPQSLTAVAISTLSAGDWIEEPGHAGHAAVILDQTAFASVPITAANVGYFSLRNGGFGESPNATSVVPLLVNKAGL